MNEFDMKVLSMVCNTITNTVLFICSLFSIYMCFKMYDKIQELDIKITKLEIEFDYNIRDGQHNEL